MTNDEAEQRHELADIPSDAVQPTNRPARRMQLKKSRSLYAGPIPPPGALAQYEETLPGAADRILTMAESQQAHRQALEVAAVNHNARRSMAGLFVGGIVALAALALAGVLAALGQPAWSAATATVAVASLAGVFVYGNYTRRKERTARLENTLNPTLDDPEEPTEPPADPQLPRE